MSVLLFKRDICSYGKVFSALHAFSFNIAICKLFIQNIWDVSMSLQAQLTQWVELSFRKIICPCCCPLLHAYYRYFINLTWKVLRYLLEICLKRQLLEAREEYVSKPQVEFEVPRHSYDGKKSGWKNKKLILNKQVEMKWC